MKTILATLFSTATLWAAAQDTSVIKMEYFIDTDPGVGNATSINVPAGNDVTFPFTVDVSPYSIGYHKLYIRTKDDLGGWSLTARRSIEVIPSETKNDVINGEYFIDTDPGFGYGTPISVSTQDTAILQNFIVTTSSLTEGYHKLYGRFRDTHGNWSQTFRRNIEVIKSENNKVINGEYFFKTDNGFGSCSPVVFAKPSSDSTFSFNIPVDQIPADADTLFVRVRDDIENRWSLTKFIVTANGSLPLTLLNFSAIEENNVAELKWQTANEVNTSYFNVQRSIDGINFTTIGKVNAKAAGSLQNDYSLADDISNLNPSKIYYRLQMMDNDGKFTFSKIVYITFDRNNLQLSIHPNPAHNYFVISNYGKMQMENSNIYVRDLSGRTLISRQFTNDTDQRINISSLAKGMYIVNIVTSGNVQTKKLVVE